PRRRDPRRNRRRPRPPPPRPAAPRAARATRGVHGLLLGSMSRGRAFPSARWRLMRHTTRRGCQALDPRLRVGRRGGRDERVTYEEMAAAWPTSASEYARPMNEIPNVVFSTTLEHADWGRDADRPRRPSRGDRASQARAWERPDRVRRRQT